MKKGDAKHSVEGSEQSRGVTIGRSRDYLYRRATEIAGQTVTTAQAFGKFGLFPGPVRSARTQPTQNILFCQRALFEIQICGILLGH